MKLLEAFASAIPVVSTRLGAEGLAAADDEICLLADEARDFAAKILSLFEIPQAALEMAARARAEVEANWDIGGATERLAQSCRKATWEKRGGFDAR